MMGNANINWTQLSDGEVLRRIGGYVRHRRMQRHRTQEQLADSAGLNRWTVSQVEKGESVTLTSLVQILRALDALYVLGEFEVTETVSPLEYARLKRVQRERVRSRKDGTPDKDEAEW